MVVDDHVEDVMWIRIMMIVYGDRSFKSWFCGMGLSVTLEGT